MKTTLFLFIFLTTTYHTEIDLTHLCQNWQVTELLVNGKPDQENYPINGDELIIYKDNTFKTIDKTFNETETGTWSINGKTLKLLSEDWDDDLTILKLTATFLKTEVHSDGDHIVMTYKIK